MKHLFKTKDFIQSQKGRSMVEMLGTLAIMGVLTIGGIAGYRYAINKSNSNTILNAVSQMAVTASTELTTQGNLTLPEWKDASGNLSINGAYGVTTAQNGDGTFSITVADMNDEVCDRIKGMDWKIPEDIIINTTDACDGGENNTIEFVFKNTMGKGSNSGQCGYCQHLDNGVCVKDAVCDNGCSGDMPVLLETGYCASCPKDDATRTYHIDFPAVNSDECNKCSLPGITWTYRNGRCYPETCGAGYWEYEGRCYSCKGGWYVHNVSQAVLDACVAACPNRYIGNDGYSSRSCIRDCPARDSWGRCLDCDTATQYWDPTWGSCNLCPGKSFSQYNYADDCVIDCPDRNYGGNVGRCCDSNEVYTDIGTTSYGHQYGACCPNARPNWDGSKCVAN